VSISIIGIVIIFIAVISGCAALIYEVVWLRLLALWMGHTTGAVGTVLAAFMGGLAAGAWAGGRVAGRLTPSQALRAYAGLELTIAVCAAALPSASALLQPLLRSTYANGDGGLTFTLARVGLSLILLLMPTIAMGATYPLLVRWFASSSAAVRASRVYAANTAGAALGVVLGGFVLLPMVGLNGATYVGVALNAVAACGAMWLARRGPAEAGHYDRGPAKAGHYDERGVVSGFSRTPSERLAIACGALAVSGFVSLVLEVIWTRVLAMVLGPTTYAFSAMLFAFITGLAIGSALAAALLPRIRQPAAWLGVTLIAAATAALTASFSVDSLPLIVAAAVADPGTTFESVLTLQVTLGIAMQLPMTIALGAAFPLAIAYVAPDPRDAPRLVAVVYASNTLGAIAGALAGSFVLVPALGLQMSLRRVAMLAIVTGVVVYWRSTGPAPAFALRATAGKKAGRYWRWTVLGGAAAAIAMSILLPPWNREHLANGAYRYAPALAAGDLAIGLEAGDLLYYREGAAGTVSVRQLPGARSLSIDGKVDASNAEDMLTQKLLAHLPLLLHPQARRVLVIGLGSGVTLGSALVHPIERADVVELSPEVVAASRFFDMDNGRALGDPRSHLVVGDGRTHLLLTDETYDVIISEPSNPWMAGVATLFTREFFLAARARLAPGGILCQWAHTYNISQGDLRSIVATFLSAFPEGSAWLVGESDLLLIGSATSPAALDQGLGSVWRRQGVGADLATVSLRDQFSLFTLFVARGSDLQRYAGGAPIQTDDRLQLEYSAPRAIYGRFERSNVAALARAAAEAEAPAAIAQVRASADPVEYRHRGLMRLSAAAPALAYDDLLSASERQPRNGELLDGLIRAALQAGRADEAQEVLTRLASSARSAPALVALSKLLAARGRSDEATNTARDAALLEPSNTAALAQLATMYADRGDADALRQLARIVEPSPLHRAVVLYCAVRLATLDGDLMRADEAAEQLVGIETTADTLNLLGTVRAARAKYNAAREAFQRALRMTPRDAGVLVNLGLVELRVDNPRAAADRFSEALFLQPTLAPAIEGLAQAYERLGDARRAAALRRVLTRR
jgi:spermidine synthase